jgi:DNA-binding transcriptional MerR regulator
MSRITASSVLPPIPAKRYFTIGEVSELTQVKPHVLRYWEQEFTQLRPLKRRGNRRYYQHHEVLLVRRIRELLYEHGFTISGARNRLESEPTPASAQFSEPVPELARVPVPNSARQNPRIAASPRSEGRITRASEVRRELEEILRVLDSEQD